MEANIMVAGVPRRPDSQDNARRISKALEAFRLQYPGAIIEEPKVEPVGKRSQSIIFAVRAPDLRTAQGMQIYFEQQLMKNGFSPTDDADDAQAGAEDILRRMVGAGSNVAYVKGPPETPKRPWWKFW